MIHSDKDVLKMAKLLANDFLDIHRICTYKDLTDVERENLERVAQLARLVSADTKDYDKNEDDPAFGGGC